MKKHVLLLLFAVFALSSHAQKGMQGIGGNVNISYDGCLSVVNYGFDLKYHYNLYKLGRIEPYASVLFASTEVSFIAGVNYHQFFYDVRKIKPYVIAGVAYGCMPAEDYWSYKSNRYIYQPNHRFIFSGGVGLDVLLTRRLSMQAEAIYSGGVSQYRMQRVDGYWSNNDDLKHLPQVKVGLTYRF